jgi:hypothetical protein
MQSNGPLPQVNIDFATAQIKFTKLIQMGRVTCHAKQWPTPTSYLDKHTLPDIAESGNQPWYGLSGQLLHSPDWIFGVRYNSSFFDAVAAAVRQVQVSLSLLPLRGAKTQPFSRQKQLQHLPIG